LIGGLFFVKWRRYATADGWPGVTWEQTVPTGETLFARRRELQWRCAVLVGLVLFGAMLGVGLPLWLAAPACLAAAFVLSSPEILRSIQIGANGAGPARGPSENERALDEEAKVIRFGRQEKRWAEVELDREVKMLRFIVTGGAGEAREPLLRVPLLDFAEFELGTDEAWLGDAGSRELREMARRGSAWVIVTQTASQGVVEIARSGGSKKEMAELHRALLAAFVAERAALRTRLDEILHDG
jgi:hypothetical protein